MIVPLQPLAGAAALDRDTFRADVLRGLRMPAKEIPSKYFYDEVGSELFDEICELPEYYPTRTELAIMERHAAEMAEAVGHRCLLIEYGSGSSVKTRLLLDRMNEPAGYVPVDISAEHLARSAEALALAYPQVEVLPLAVDFTGPLELPVPRQAPARRVVYFPGSTVGNFTPAEASTLLRRTARLVGTAGGLLLGADLKKHPRVLHAAYNDAQGVTERFNRNMLVRINRELDGDFPVEQFWHHAFYTPAAGRIEMHLVSSREQRVRIAGEHFHFAEGESIRTEYSYKYSVDDLHALARRTGFAVTHLWTDPRDYFSVLYLVVR